jgi:hypothetical protein
MQLDNTIKERWLNALTSGEYSQGEGFLRAGDHYCCLGVLCDVMSKTEPENVGTWASLDSEDESEDDYEYNFIFELGGRRTEDNGVLPADFRDKIGMPDHDQDTLIALNDANYPFTAIADAIRCLSGDFEMRCLKCNTDFADVKVGPLGSPANNTDSLTTCSELGQGVYGMRNDHHLWEAV